MINSLNFDDIIPYTIFRGIRGSYAYGTNIKGSDIDEILIYVLPEKYICTVNFDPNWEEIKIKNPKKNTEITCYELRKLLRLLEVNNPNLFEIFNLPSDCILYKNPVFDILLNNEKSFITKGCSDTFLNYGYSQLRKARGGEKKQNWEKSRIERRGVLDFCSTFAGRNSMPIKDWLASHAIGQENCGLSKIDHMSSVYGVYHLENTNLGGIVRDEEKSNNISLTKHIPIGVEPICYMYFNESAYSLHCTEYKSYQTWLRERNEQRWVDVKTHNQKIDGKNLLHCVRLIMMAEDIAEGRGIVVRRPEAEYLKSIRRGEVSLNDLISWSSDKLASLEDKFKKSDLPEKTDPKIVQNIYDRIRESVDWWTP